MTLALPARSARLALAAPALGVAALAVFGLALRLGFSGGPLGNDEIWSLDNLRPISHFWRVLWGISHDNNHFFNSLWLYFVWPVSQNATLLRLPSILAGAAAIPLMAALGARRSAAAALVAAALTSLSFFQIAFSDQARGYAMATCALIAAYLALERALDAPQWKARWVFAAAAGLAVFSHLAAGPALALYALIAFAELLRRRGAWFSALREILGLFSPAALAVAPCAAFVIAGILQTGGFTIGYHRDFSAGHVIAAFANLEMTTFGLNPSTRWQVAFALLALPLIIIAAIVFCARSERRITFAAMIFLLPAAAVLLKIPNTHAPRYYFAASPFLILLAAEVFDFAWTKGVLGRALAIVALAASLAGDGASLARMAAGLSSPWTEALERIAASPDPRLTGSFDFNVGRSVGHFNRYGATPVELVNEADACATRPLWRVVELAGADADARELTLGGDRCALRYALTGIYSRDVPSQPAWALYRRVNDAR